MIPYSTIYTVTSFKTDFKKNAIFSAIMFNKCFEWHLLRPLFEF